MLETDRAVAPVVGRRVANSQPDPGGQQRTEARHGIKTLAAGTAHARAGAGRRKRLAAQNTGTCEDAGASGEFRGGAKHGTHPLRFCGKLSARGGPACLPEQPEFAVDATPKNNNAPTRYKPCHSSRRRAVLIVTSAINISLFSSRHKVYGPQKTTP